MRIESDKGKITVWMDFKKVDADLVEIKLQKGHMVEIKISSKKSEPKLIKQSKVYINTKWG